MVEFTDSISARIATQMALDNAKIFELHKLADKKKKNQSTRKNTIYKEKLNKIMREDRNNSLSYPSESDLEDSRMRHKKNIQGYPIYHIHTDYPIQGSSMEHEESCYITSRRESIDYGSFLRRLSTCSRDSGYDMNIRRLSLCSSGSEQNGFCRSRSNSGITMMHLPENVMRMPSGPDGTRGFFCRSAKMSMPIEPT
ncbi:hypothetical protein X777_06639 [Ooceraea biroi]|uniref:SUZ-C domain-containing protein n=1 Tax=Ooceraea biroi TaxID=2015173 RepID=A0A026WCM7_OOCBI|nr:hypothetical protein X777_06639 [Ooceraea biroi]